jgi:thioredoxin reductase
VVVSIGTRGRPRRLGVPGEELPKVTALLDDPARYAGRRVLVVGGGDSAVEAAVALGEAGARTTLSYRGRVLSRCRAKNRQALDEAVRLRRVELRFGTRVTEIREGQVVLESADGARVELGNDRVFTCIGGDAPVKWLASIGVRFSDQPHMARRAPTDRVVRRLIGAPEAPDQPTIVISLAG